MSEMYRLRELAALLQPPRQPVVEVVTKKTSSSFEGIKSIVEDAMADLHDKLGEGGSLETLLDQAGLAGLDKKGDKEGETILERLATSTAKFKKETDALLLEVELMLASAAE